MLKASDASRRMKVDLLQATTTHYYHAVPSELERVTISPEKTAIFEYLSRIGSDRFVEFIADVLVHVEGHTFVDKTDGPGDEKQDILTLRPDGQRHLTQSKHTARYGDNSSGDELDILVAACLRKNCRSALYVTNADLTVQAKRYVTDREYERGWPAAAEFRPDIDYWNGDRIWHRIAGNE
ncbi:MAG: restriction endonuclease, partial [Acidobacteriota bacterium]|nr:restriction endonuclease [Acidobacteriota bacterium]